MNLDEDVTKVSEARLVARAWARQNNKNEDRCEVLAEIWFDAGKDDCTGRALEAHLSHRFNS